MVQDGGEPGLPLGATQEPRDVNARSRVHGEDDQGQQQRMVELTCLISVITVPVCVLCFLRSLCFMCHERVYVHVQSLYGCVSHNALRTACLVSSHLVSVVELPLEEVAVIVQLRSVSGLPPALSEATRLQELHVVEARFAVDSRHERAARQTGFDAPLTQTRSRHFVEVSVPFR